MPSPAQAFLLSWSVPPAATFAIVLTALIYLRGWLLMRWARVPFVPPWRAACFLTGLLTVWIALASPLDTFSGFLITAHMLQHMLLMMVAPPLLLLGAPLIPLVRGLPIFAAREFAGPFLNWRMATRLGNFLIHPAVALILMALVMFGWHTPRFYELALTSSGWHEFEHACFFFASLIFWWPVIQPWPSREWQRPRWVLVPYLFLGDLQNTIVSAILVFSDRVIYLSYSAMPRLFGFSALADQVASGAIMWVLGSTIMLIPATVIAIQCLSRPKVGHAQVKLENSAFDFVGPLDRMVSAPARLLQRSITPARAEAVSFVVLFLAAGLTLAALASRSSDDDDQALRVSQTAGPFVVSVFALPGDLDVGSSEFAVMVQDRDTLESVLDARVALQATVGSQSVGPVRASDEDSENRLMQTAELNLPAEGDWSIQVNVQNEDETASVNLPVRVTEEKGETNRHWPYLILGTLAGILALTYWRRPRATTTTHCNDQAEVVRS
jgi:putative membrane protein